MLGSTLREQLGRLEGCLGPHHLLPQDRLDNLHQILGTRRERREGFVKLRILQVLREATEDLVGDGRTLRL
jgi:hypothetical protein